MIAGPSLEGDTWTWRGGEGAVRVAFVGRGSRESARDAAAILGRLEAEPPRLAWVKQIHSAAVLPAHPGPCGEGDALTTSEAGLALAIFTADCVPLVLAGPEGIAAVHAGWRGIVAEILPAALASVTADPTQWKAWIGPAIGPCCYEVGEEVAEKVVVASAPEIAVPGPHGRPHLDLQKAARVQLERLGVREISAAPGCTRCEEEKLWSYRRDGKGGGRNVAFIWREG
jgi:polyphenol oxidase